MHNKKCPKCHKYFDTRHKTQPYCKRCQNRYSYNIRQQNNEKKIAEFWGREYNEPAQQVNTIKLPNDFMDNLTKNRENDKK